MIDGGLAHRGKRRAIWAAALLTTTTMAGAVWTTSAQAQTAAQRSFDIPAQSLPSALTIFGRQSGLQVSVPAGLAAGHTSSAVSGTMTPHDALSRLLTGTGLVYKISGNIVTLEPAPQAADGAIQLGPVRVEGTDGNAPAGYVETTTGPVIGYVARRSQTATKTDTPITEIPQSVSVIGRDEIEMRGALNMMDIVAQTPGISVNTYGPDNRGWEYINIRGFSANSGNFRDGLSQANFGVVYYMTDPYAVERVEVLRGPSSVIYGQADAGGIINRISKRPTADPIHEIALQYGSFDRKQAAFDFGGAIDTGKTLSARLVGVALDSNDQDSYPDGTRIDRQRYMLAPSLRWQPSDDTSLTVLGQWLKSKSGEDPYYAVAADLSLTRVKMGDYSFSDFKQDQWSLGYEFEHRFSDSWSFQQNARYSEVSLDRRAIWVNELQADGHTYSRFARTWNDGIKQLSFDSRINGSLNTGAIEHVIVAGVDYNHQTGTALRRRGPAPDLDLLAPVYGQVIATPTGVLQDFTQRQRQIGLYAQDQIKAGEHWVLTLGGRMDFARAITDNRRSSTRTVQKDEAFSGRAGLTYLIGNGLAPYVSYTESFLPALGLDANGEPFKPTRGRQVEAGLKYRPEGSSLLLTAAFFNLTKTNVVTYDNMTGDARQIGKQRSRGLELEAKAEVLPGLNATASYTRLFGKIVQSADATEVGKKPAIIPEQTASAWLDYTALMGLGLGVGVNYTGERPNDEANTTIEPGFWLFNASAHYETGPWRLIVSASNLFNNNYNTICYHGECYLGEKRSVTATLRYKW
ncbi:TonB-dependent siderophore receptor [Novosphingobium resinovorum]|uniref:TonB-dependent siderophore receptor n=1 Tax=Novosphingobium resinovorum TaxID=158500 RepID=UPI002ED66EAC|nr:TonB-dependent siderophore receptor [Novosphingobium resinovorum]